MEYRKYIMQMMEEVGDDDIIFLQQMYTFLKIHLERKKEKTHE